MFAPQLNWLGLGPSVESQVRGVWARAWTVNVCVCLVAGGFPWKAARMPTNTIIRKRALNKRNPLETASIH